MVEIVHILLVLPDGKVVLQRRDGKTPFSPNMLALFGGHVEAGEPPDVAIRRELSEETSLNTANLVIQLVDEFKLTSKDGTVTHFYTYRSDIPDAEFEVYEGRGAEVYPADQALAREDIVPSVRHSLMKLGG